MGIGTNTVGNESINMICRNRDGYYVSKKENGNQ